MISSSGFLCSNTSRAKASEILISSSTYSQIKELGFVVQRRGKVPVKGRRGQVGIYNVIGFKEAQNEEESRINEI